MQTATEALQLWQQLYPPNDYPDGHPGLATCLSTLSTLHEAQGDFGPALAYAQQSQSILAKFYAPDRYPAGAL